MKVIINGGFLSDKMKGIVRYAIHVVKHMDNLVTNDDVVYLVCPNNATIDLKLKNIQTIKVGKRTGLKWELFDLKKYENKHKDFVCLNLCNVSPSSKNKNITTIHDIMYKTDFSDFKSLKNKLSAIWHRQQYRYISKHSSVIVTDSNLSKNQINTHYPKSKNKISVVYLGWQHVLEWKENPNWKTDYPFLKEKEYFFSLASLAKNKNGKWIIETAKNNPNETFVIGGRFYNDDSMNQNSLPKNVHLLGYISDEDACSLIKNCKAFLFPSINEGFGLPPLEALALGSKVISSNVEPMTEILKEYVYYIDPYKYDYDLNKLLDASLPPREELLKELDWDNTAKQIYQLLKETSNGK